MLSVLLNDVLVIESCLSFLGEGEEVGVAVRNLVKETQPVSYAQIA